MEKTLPLSNCSLKEEFLESSSIPINNSQVGGIPATHTIGGYVEYNVCTSHSPLHEIIVSYVSLYELNTLIVYLQNVVNEEKEKQWQQESLLSSNYPSILLACTNMHDVHHNPNPCLGGGGRRAIPDSLWPASILLLVCEDPTLQPWLLLLSIAGAPAYSQKSFLLQ